ncbi:polysaccharide biosynthesis C-terminal domain-containing protein [Haloferax sp. YSMS24]|uniref:oligosaccharide flippase family protein n=1 Tax=Haloferax sp. YSMS24 TaxID=3388425 RepID=UPI00398CE5B6
MSSSVFRGFISIFGAKVITLLSGFLLTPILVRLLGSSMYGDYAFLLSLLGVTMIIVNAGVFDGTRKFVAENRDQEDWTERVFGFYLRTAIALATVAAIIYMVISWIGFSQQAFGPKFDIYFYLLSGLIIVRQADSVARGGLMGLGLEDRSEPLRILKNLLFFLIGLSLVYVGYGVVGVFIGHILASLIVSSVGFVLLFQQLETQKVFARVRSSLPKWELLSFNSLSVILILLTASLYHTDIIILRYLVGSEATGYYKAALVVAEFLWFVPVTLQTVLLHSTSEMWSEGQMERITNLASKITRYNLSLTLLLGMGIAVLAQDFIPLYFGPDFDKSVGPLLLLLPGALGFALARPIFAVGQGKGALNILILATGTAALINLFLNLLLIPRYGMAGAAMATSMGYGSMFGFHVLAARRIGFNPLKNVRVSRIILIGTLSAPAIIATEVFLSSPIISLLIVPPTGFVVYTALLFKFGVITLNEVNDIIVRFPSPIPQYLIPALNEFR